MFTLLSPATIDRHPDLANGMFVGRGVTFKERLGWKLQTDAQGRERDEYDLLNPIYVVLSNDEGRHVGSFRIMPTLGRTMLAEHFADLTDGIVIRSAFTWEVTRFFVEPDAKARACASAALMWAGCQMALDAGVESIVAVTYTKIAKLFRYAGWAPEILGTRPTSEGIICACLSEVSETTCARLQAVAGLSDLDVCQLRSASASMTDTFIRDNLLSTAPKPSLGSAGHRPYHLMSRDAPDRSGASAQ